MICLLTFLDIRGSYVIAFVEDMTVMVIDSWHDLGDKGQGKNIVL